MIFILRYELIEKVDCFRCLILPMGSRAKSDLRENERTRSFPVRLATNASADWYFTFCLSAYGVARLRLSPQGGWQAMSPLKRP